MKLTSVLISFFVLASQVDVVILQDFSDSEDSQTQLPPLPPQTTQMPLEDGPPDITMPLPSETVGPSTTAAEPAAESGVEPQSETGENPAAAPVEGGIDSDDRKDDSLVDYAARKIGEMFGSGSETDSQSSQNDTTPNLTEEQIIEKEMEECSLPDTLDRYNCTTIPKAVYDYFGGNVSVQGLLNGLYSDSVNGDLRNCTSGEWCLPFEEHLKIKQSLPEFFMKGPFCSDAMTCSLEKMLEKRERCEEKPLMYLINSVALLCDMRRSYEIDSPEPQLCQDYDECYARTMEALYVLYEDIQVPNEQHLADLERDDCNDFKVHIAKTYLCASECCQFSQREILTRFELWARLPVSAQDIQTTCNFTVDCEHNRRPSNNDENVNENVDENIDENVDENEEGENLLNAMYPDYDSTQRGNETVEEEEEEEMEAAEVMEAEAEAIDEIIQEIEKEGNETDEGTVGPTGSADNSFGDLGEFSGMDMAGGGGEDDHTIIFGVVTVASMVLLSLLLILLVGYRRFRHSKAHGYRRGYSQLTEEETRMLKNEYN
ncbi:uncharacterized protein LOC106013075 [Aplysia californica]|uniref:Uncharacterized protein LOC106013075 n=1 Tax=Aplysia californica TaxID=6500 RepID=A0ABM1A9C1_APLCA|nr:uncharacterized protein LOC106013075 [Aplysia californica]